MKVLAVGWAMIFTVVVLLIFLFAGSSCSDDNSFERTPDYVEGWQLNDRLKSFESEVQEGIDDKFTELKAELLLKMTAPDETKFERFFESRIELCAVHDVQYPDDDSRKEYKNCLARGISPWAKNLCSNLRDEKLASVCIKEYNRQKGRAKKK